MQFAGLLKSNLSGCPKTHATLIIQDGEVAFAPDDGTWVLQGHVRDGNIEASHSRPSFDHKMFTTELKATQTDAKIVGTYTTSACTYAVDLTRF